jgi:hypothetical protein
VEKSAPTLVVCLAPPPRVVVENVGSAGLSQDVCVNIVPDLSWKEK